MKLSILPTAALLAAVDLSVAAPQPRATCSSPVLRKEWSQLSLSQKTSYQNAVKCLATKPSKIGLNTTLYDDFTYVHHALDQKIHGVAAFLPWHRYFLAVYETELKSCGYTSVLPYWDWVASSSAPASATVWDLSTGLGGNGTDDADPAKRCIKGPFANLRPAYFKDEYKPHCITREFFRAIPEAGYPEMLGWQYAPDVIASVNANAQFLTFQGALQGGPHNVVHAAISGDMGPVTSPNDPIFFLVHGNVDRLWWLWQQQNPSSRNYDYAGTEFGGVPATLDHVLEMGGLAPARAVRDFMITKSADLCYKYV